MQATMDDRQLVTLARKGDQDAFTRLVERHQKMVYNLALGKTGSHHDAEEVTQTAFFKAWQGLPSFQGKAAFSSWLYRLTVNAAIDLLRQRKKHQGALSLDDPDLPVVPDRGPSPEELSEEHERRQLLWQAIESLPEPHRIPLLLREIEGLSYREIAQALDLEEGTVKSRLARARLLLRKLLLQKGNLPTGSPSNQLGRKGGMSKLTHAKNMSFSSAPGWTGRSLSRRRPSCMPIWPSAPTAASWPRSWRTFKPR